ncbi:MAG: hypothetical protein Q8K26_00330 [Candidatus Gracilibacteria bacterium]|nr:hypothetical protein [Candidatus Gracilibacteria bacterium]
MSRLSYIALTIFISPFLIPSLWAEEGYISKDLGTDIYRRIDEGHMKLKKQLIGKRLEGSAKKINELIGKMCGGEYCLRDIPDFTAVELDNIAAGGVGDMVSHLDSGIKIDTDLAMKIGNTIIKHYEKIQQEVSIEQQKLQTVGSIGLFTDGNTDNSSYDLMYDLEQIHNVIFAYEIPYGGTANIGDSAIANILQDRYSDINPLAFLSNLAEDIPSGFDRTPPDNTLPTGTGASAVSALLSLGSDTCSTGTGNALGGSGGFDDSLYRDVLNQVVLGTNQRSDFSLTDDSRLPEFWARGGNGGVSSMNGGGSFSDNFLCSGADIFCITTEFVSYAQDILGGGAAYTIEAILDENLKIADKFASSSMGQAKHTNNFFQLSLKNLGLDKLIHLGAVVSYLPPPILNLKPGTTSGEGNTKPVEDEFKKILIGSFEDAGLDHKRQNSIEKDMVDSALSKLPYQTTDSLGKKLVIDTPAKTGFVQAKERELKKTYFDSFNDDLFELHAFTSAFSKQLEAITSVIKGMYEIKKG